MNNSNLTRRRLMQLLTVTMIGNSFSKLGATNPQSPNKSLSPQIFEDPQPVYIPPGGGQKGKIADNEIVFKLDKSQTSGLLGSTEGILLPGYLGAPPHLHKGFDEICIVQEGAVHIMVGEEVVEVPAGGWHLRPRGMVHTFWNSGKTPARYIELFSPGGHEEYMKELAQLFENGKRPKPDDLSKLASRHDITFHFDKLKGLMDKYKVHL